MGFLGMSKGAWDACWDVYKVDAKEKGVALEVRYGAGCTD